ncbi:hypothetical protein FNV43_RR25178 [Rhamnella rubrinervis]|uniref:Uncharacterized protein n=1 Tax=Rhamnella rubrinervis TaxID=2594499 RepID=A0A8K0DN55_9ROSA|nr:hypothetical protein FNV43_RR25178 [Rhamnella rubrinervis]
MCTHCVMTLTWKMVHCLFTQSFSNSHVARAISVDVTVACKSRGISALIWSHIQIDQLKDIETLKDITSSALIPHDALNKLTDLRCLGIHYEGTDDVRRISESMYSTSLHSLQFLPASLTKLILWESGLEKDPMPALERLPNLRFLNMSYEAYYGSQMVCSAYGFPKLETLQLSSLLHVRNWIVKNGAMSSLKKLHIERIRNLEMTPEGLKFVTMLKKLSITCTDSSFCEKLGS